ncbi:hypothetical protein A0H81_13503 [Grifola frondosa]|uniref:Phosphosulfolactate synthase n=1 Tax=Grifola frondosa TaxID=5627 RepID=A0A1C7LP85_GRIFR|nr:hypothetical protein A0H81_13503 [Grifola frondosa]
MPLSYTTLHQHAPPYHSTPGYPRSPPPSAHRIPRAFQLSPIPATPSSSSATTYPFSFLPANSLEPKHTRTKGLTEIRGPYYAPVTKTYLDELLGDWGEYVDGVKFAGGAFSLMPQERLTALIDVAHKHGTRTQNASARGT